LSCTKVIIFLCELRFSNNLLQQNLYYSFEHNLCKIKMPSMPSYNGLATEKLNCYRYRSGFIRDSPGLLLIFLIFSLWVFTFDNFLILLRNANEHVLLFVPLKALYSHCNAIFFFFSLTHPLTPISHTQQSIIPIQTYFFHVYNYGFRVFGCRLDKIL